MNSQEIRMIRLRKTVNLMSKSNASKLDLVNMWVSQGVSPRTAKEYVKTATLIMNPNRE